MVLCNEVRKLNGGCLHDAIAYYKLVELRSYVNQHQHHLELNCENNFGDTPLLTTLKENCCDDTIMFLINAGCDINKFDFRRFSPLHIAATRPFGSIIVELLRRGANVDAMDMYNITPSHIAVIKNNSPAIDLLLSYGADLNIRDCYQATPLRMALQLNRISICSILFSALDQLHSTSELAKKAADEAIAAVNPLVYDLIKSGVFMYDSCNEEFFLNTALKSGDIELFQFVWSVIDKQNLLNNSTPYLLTYMNKCFILQHCKWMECLQTLLTSSFGNQLIKECASTTLGRSKAHFLQILLHCFRRFKVNPKDRMYLLRLSINQGITITVNDVRTAWELFGFNDELDVLISSFKIDVNSDPACELGPILTFVFGVEKDNSVEYIFELFKNQIIFTNFFDEILFATKYFSLPSKLKNELMRLCQRHIPEYFKRIAEGFYGVPDVPALTSKQAEYPTTFFQNFERTQEVPSLLELSRNKVRDVIKETYKIQQPYHFHRAVVNLEVPNVVKDIIRLKARIYN